MIQSILWSSLVVGSVLMNAVAIGDDGGMPGTANRQPGIVQSARQPAKQPSSGRPLTRPASAMARLKSLRSGLATWYGKVLDRHRTASGEIFDCTALTGASNTLPFGTRVQVTNLRNGRSVVVRVNDRGILAPGNIIDITSAAAEKIGLLKMGVAPVHLEVVL
jgi:rare lipoprotein A